MSAAESLPLDGPAGAVLFAALGLVAGSFATAASHRLPRNLPIMLDRSRCPSCGHALGARDLVPVVSWLAARGRCRHCGAPVPTRYPAIELVTMALFLGAWALNPGDAIAAALLALSALGLVVISVADFEAGIIPDLALLALAPVAVLWRWHRGDDWIDALLGAAIGALLFGGLRLAYKALRGHHGLGPGDVKFVALAGFFVGISGLAPFLLLSGVFGVVMGLGWRFAGRGAAFPFGPALCLALAVLLARPDWAAILSLFSA